MVSEGFGNFIAKGDRQANSRDVNPLETIWIIVDEDKEPKNTKNQPPNNWTSYGSDYASPGKVCL